MTAAGDITSITGRTTDTQGRFLVTARTNHFVSDARTGPGEAVGAGELLLSALASCSLSNIQLHAEERGSGLTGGRAEISYQRDPQDPTRYTYLRIELLLEGVDQDEADILVGLFTGSCPIYNTLRRGGHVEVAVRVQEPLAGAA
ncbi:OsmC family protein [Streptomyces sp. NPDC050388]|uniref:OsmC family protein n=1 Tax=Streptomyces sp. NPDC050388 TaxID=3155781 RepID=UPI0034445142